MKALLGSLVGSVQKGIHPRHVGVAVFLGSLAGFTTGWNLTLLVVLLLALLLRHHWKVFLQSWGAFYALSWLMTPWCYRTGQYLLEGSLGRWLAPHADSLWLALWDLDRYTLLGGVFWGSLVGLGAGYLAAALARTLQSAAARVQQQAEQQPGKAGRLAWRVVCRVVFGSWQVSPAPASRPRWISWAGAALLLGVVVPGGVLGYLLLPRLVWYTVSRALWMANGAEVNTQAVQLSLSRGYLQIEKLQVADPDHLQRDQFQVQHIVAVVRPGPLLRGRLVADRVVFDGLQVDVPRQFPAQAWNGRLPQMDFPQLVPSLLSQQEEARAEDSKSAGPEKSLSVDAWEEYLQQGQKWKQRLVRIRRWIETLERIAGAEETAQDDSPNAVPRSWTAMRQARCRFGRPCPRVWIGQLVIRRLPRQWGFGSQAAVQVVNITSRPRLSGKPTRLELLAPECGLELLADFNFHRDDLSHAVALQWQPPQPQKLVRLPEQLPLRATPGRVLVQGQGWFSRESIQLPLRVRARELSWQTSAEELWGVDAQVWKQALLDIDSVELRCRLQGSWSRPQLQVDTRQLLAQLQQRFQRAGYDAVAQAVAARAGVLKQKAQVQLTQAKQQLQQQVETQKARLQAAQQKAQQQLAHLQQQAQQEVQKGSQSLLEVTQQAQKQLAQQADQLQQQATRKTAQLAEQAAQSVQKPLAEAAQQAKQATKMLQQLQRQTAEASHPWKQLRQQTQQLGSQLRQGAQEAKQAVEQLTQSQPGSSAPQVPSSRQGAADPPQPLVRKNPYVGQPLPEAQGEKSSAKSETSTVQVFVPESVASPMAGDTTPQPEKKKPSQAELAAQLGVQVVETPASQPPAATQGNFPPARANVAESPPSSSPRQSPTPKPMPYYGDPLAIATDQPEGAPGIASHSAGTVRPYPGRPTAGVSAGLVPSGLSGSSARGRAGAGAQSGSAPLAGRGFDPASRLGRDTRPASFAPGESSPPTRALGPAMPGGLNKNATASRPGPQRRVPPQPPVARPQEEKKSFWARMSQGVSDGFKRLWPFKKKPPAEQTATLPPARLSPTAPKAPATRPRLPRLDPPMPVQEAKVPWYQKLFRR